MTSDEAGNSIATPRGRASQSSSTVEDNSPTNSTITDFATNATASFRSFGGVELSRTMGDGNPYQNGTQATRPLVIRGDASLLTCFDPADKELYEVWARRG